MPLRTILITATRSGTASTVIIRRGASGTGTGGTGDHGALAGLGDDDHTQYLNNARGDARYAPIASPTFTGNATADQFNTFEGAAYSTAGIQFLAGAGPGNVSYNVSFSAGDPTATRSTNLPDASGTLAVTSRSDGKIVAAEITGVLPITSGGTGAANLDALQPKITSLNASEIRTDLGLNTDQSVTFAGVTTSASTYAASATFTYGNPAAITNHRNAMGLGSGQSPTFAGTSLGNGSVSTPAILFANNYGIYNNTAIGSIAVISSGSTQAQMGAGGFICKNTGVYAITSGGNAGGTIDTGISRKTNIPGTIMVGNGTANNASGSLELTNLTASGAIILPTSTTPLSAGAAGVAGTIVRDASYLYVCTATNTWTRIALAW